MRKSLRNRSRSRSVQKKRQQQRRQKKSKTNNNKVQRRRRRQNGGDATLQWSGPDSTAPAPLRNGGWYSGPQATGDWKSIYVPPTTSGAIKNLASGNPPPGAMQQYPGTVRLGNSYYGTDDLQNFDSTLPSNPGPFKMTCTGGARRKSRRNTKRRRNNRRK